MSEFKVGDVIVAVADDPSGYEGWETGDVFTVEKDSAGYLYFEDNKGDFRVNTAFTYFKHHNSEKENSMFKAGDIVVCVDDICTGDYLKKGQEYTITKVHDNTDVAVNGICNNIGWFASRFELKQHPAEQETKLVPFTHELWEKWKDKGVKVVYANGPHTVEDLVCFSNAVTTFRYAVYAKECDCVYVCEMDDLSLEIPVTAKRIPFDPERKDAKVFYGEQKLLEWVQMKSGVVCGVIKAGPFDGEHTSLYHPNDLKMEIEE